MNIVCVKVTVKNKYAKNIYEAIKIMDDFINGGPLTAGGEWQLS